MDPGTQEAGMRQELSPPRITDTAVKKLKEYQADVVDEVREAVRTQPVVVVGMGWNPHVRKARRALDEAGIPYTYLGYGNYLTGWRKRLAIKIWAGWPTFPQVFVSGRLIGGAEQTIDALADGSIRKLMESSAPTPKPSADRQQQPSIKPESAAPETKSATETASASPSESKPAETASSPESKPASESDVSKSKETAASSEGEPSESKASG